MRPRTPLLFRTKSLIGSLIPEQIGNRNRDLRISFGTKGLRGRVPRKCFSSHRNVLGIVAAHLGELEGSVSVREHAPTAGVKVHRFDRCKYRPGKRDRFSLELVEQSLVIPAHYR